jgi:hypothetical protein
MSPEADLVESSPAHRYDALGPIPRTVDDQSQGIQHCRKIKPLVAYWGTGYDWRKADEAKLKACRNS